MLTITEAIANIDLTNIHRRMKYPLKGKCYHLQKTFFLCLTQNNFELGEEEVSMRAEQK